MLATAIKRAQSHSYIKESQIIGSSTCGLNVILCLLLSVLQPLQQLSNVSYHHVILHFVCASHTYSHTVTAITMTGPSGRWYPTAWWMFQNPSVQPAKPTYDDNCPTDTETRQICESAMQLVSWLNFS